MSYFSIPDNTTNTQNPSFIKQNEPTTAKTIGFALSIIFGSGGLIVAGIGIGFCMGSISGLNQVNSIIMIATGGVSGIVLLVVGVVGSVKTEAQKKAEPEKETKKDATPKQNEQVKKNKEKEATDKTKELEKQKAKEKEERLAKKLAKAAAKEQERTKAKEKEGADKDEELKKQKAKEAEKAKEIGKGKQPDGKEILFSDHVAKLYDRTAAKVVDIRLFSEFCPLAVKGEQDHDVILLGNAMVLFSNFFNAFIDAKSFSDALSTKHVTVEDEGRAGIYRIREVQTNGLPDTIWIVDTNKKFLIDTKDDTGKFEVTLVVMPECQIPPGYDSGAPGVKLQQRISGSITRTLKKE